MAKSKLCIKSKGQLYECAVEEGIVWETHRKGTPGKLTFNVIKDGMLSFHEGDEVIFEYDGHKIFKGFVFTKKRSNNRIITVTCYDQLRYFKNKETYRYENRTATQVLQLIAKNFKLKTGTIDNTKYVLPCMVEDNQELFTVMANALAETTLNTQRLFVLYDDFGALNLREAKTLQTDLLIDEESGESFEYTSSIDENTYNKIKLVRENKETGERATFMAESESRMTEWGVLQLTDKFDEGVNGKAKAESMLNFYNRKSRKLHINKVFGNPIVRGGSQVAVLLDVGDLSVANFMMVESVRHTFKESNYRMDLSLIGGDFIA
ncbi:hydrolase [Lysinibacillus fusiformis]|uniref:XkdQ/YqbQ family protein n=1 Tax=Lysinibacillus fusiformis TaxID=28031 RepID=UPI0011BB98BC|nr:hydrolase [Lysinibacillus fusiformis]MDC6268931.1 hydrolase [Lysinibacillus sphaericus]KAB0441624.1 hydrolase [Lysinibacillus fusiformis]MCT6816971.1 hydrolase [Lysinibacillus fusiformis]MCT6928321.1 hydrolase [Lysinibacillus fusiformis]MCT6933570.1 hydrolase [Lysinibacillus fusiformis]